MASLTDILSGNAEEAAKKQVEGIILGTKAAAKRLGEGQKNYEKYGNLALGEFDPYAPQAQTAYGLYGDALGLNGAEGTASAQDAFTTSPGYDFEMGQGLQALERSASARGMLGSGNLSADILDFSQGLANKNYGSWLDRLGDLGSQGINMATNRATIQTGIGGKAYETGESLADLGWKAATGAGNALAQKESAEGQGLLGGISLGTQLLGSALGGLGGLGKVPMSAYQGYSMGSFG